LRYLKIKFEILTVMLMLISFSFFESKPKTSLYDESGESKIEADRLLMSTDEEEKDRPAADSSLGSSNR
jgi:hypothetical protein